MGNSYRQKSRVQHTSSVNMMVFELIKTGTITVITVHIWASWGGGGGLKRRSSAIHLNPSSLKC